MGKTVERVVFDATPQFKRKRTAAYARVSVGTDAIFSNNRSYEFC